MDKILNEKSSQEIREELNKENKTNYIFKTIECEGA